MNDWVDTHCHLHHGRFDEDRDAVVQRARQAGVTRILTIGTDLKTSRQAVRCAEKYPEAFAAVGVQPNSTHQVCDQDWPPVVELLDHPRVVGIGECGLDWYRDFSPPEVQRRWFRKHLELAEACKLPLVIHCRDAENDVLAMIAEHPGAHGVMHSYTGSAAGTVRAVELGFYVSFAGMVTYPKSDDLRAVVREVPHDRLLVETDAPYLAPQPRRGKRNEPGFVTMTGTVVAQQCGVSADQLAAITSANADRLFGLNNAPT